MERHEARLGIDIGGVVISRPRPGEDTVFLGASEAAALETPPFHQLFEALAGLVERFEKRVWLVSKCGRRIEDRTRRWLARHRFFERTGIPQEQIRFCRDRPGKAPICRELRITHFIDDRLDVLGYLDGVVPYRYLFAPPATASAPHGIVTLAGWGEALSRVATEGNGTVYLIG